MGWITIKAMSSLALLLLIVLIVWVWLASLTCSDIALQAARDSCHHLELQFLDGTVSLRRITPFYMNIDYFGLQRTYVFDYSEDGLSRQTGCIVLQNKRVVSIIVHNH